MKNRNSIPTLFKKIGFKISFAVLSLFLFSCVSTSSSSSANFNFPKTDKVTLENGLELYFLHDSSLPFVTLQAVIEVGSAQDYKGKEGLAYLSFEMLKEGSKTKPGAQLKKAYSDLATSLHIDIDRDLVSLSTKSLAKYSDDLASLFVETIQRPEFSATRFNKIKNKHIATLKRTAENPSSRIDWIFYRNLYGEDHPYAYPTPGTIEGVKNIKATDLKSFYKKEVQPNKMQIALTGDFKDSTKKILIQRLSALANPKKDASEKAKQRLSRQFHQVKPQATKIIFVNKPGMSQAEVRVGYVGVARNYPKFIPLYLANSVIGGGGFSSRLMQEARVKRGLVYGIYSAFVGLKKPGPFMVGASTRHEKIPELIQLILQQLESARLDGVSEAELKDQKSTTYGQYPRSLETKHFYIGKIMKYKVYGLHENYLKNYLKYVDETNQASANALLKEKYRNTNLVITILGSKDKLGNGLKEIGIPVEFKN